MSRKGKLKKIRWMRCPRCKKKYNPFLFRFKKSFISNNRFRCNRCNRKLIFPGYSIIYGIHLALSLLLMFYLAALIIENNITNLKLIAFLVGLGLLYYGYLSYHLPLFYCKPRIDKL